jgi:hypothetical protein
MAMLYIAWQCQEQSLCHVPLPKIAGSRSCAAAGRNGATAKSRARDGKQSPHRIV